VDSSTLLVIIVAMGCASSDRQQHLIAMHRQPHLVPAYTTITICSHILLSADTRQHGVESASNHSDPQQPWQSTHGEELKKAQPIRKIEIEIESSGQICLHLGTAIPSNHLHALIVGVPFRRLLAPAMTSPSSAPF
jgi:hypothetical protein